MCTSLVTRPYLAMIAAYPRPSNFYLGCSGVHCNDQHPILLFSISRDHTDTEDRMAELRETLNLWKNQKTEFISELQAKVSLVLPLHSQGTRSGSHCPQESLVRDIRVRRVRQEIKRVKEFPTMHYLGIPRHTQSMIAHKIGKGKVVRTPSGVYGKSLSLFQ